MKIIKNGFYILNEKNSSLIEIEEGIYAFVFLNNLEKSFKFVLKEDSRLDLFGFSDKKTSANLIINQAGNNSELKIKYMFFNHKVDLTSNIKSVINSNNSKSNIIIVSIIKDKKLSIDSSIEIEQGLIGVEVDLKHKNIFIGNSGLVRGLPKLLVKSASVKASHSCKIERINNDLLFYLKSRGINENKAILMMTESYFLKNFKCLKMMDENYYNNIYNDFLTLNK